MCSCICDKVGALLSCHSLCILQNMLNYGQPDQNFWMFSVKSWPSYGLRYVFFCFYLFSVLPLGYGLIQEEVEFALRSCCNRDPSILYQSSVRGESGLGARAAASSLLSTRGVLKSLEGVWGSVSVQVGGSGGGWIAVVNESRCQVFHEHDDNAHGAQKKLKKEGGGDMMEHKREKENGEI